MSLLQKASIITTPTAYAEDYLYSIKPALSLGAEEITNGNFSVSGTINATSYSLGFASSDTGGTFTISNGQVTLARVSGSTRLRGTNGVDSLNFLTSGKKYRLVYNVISNNGASAFYYYNGSTGVAAPSTVGQHTIDYTSAGTQFYLETQNNGSNITLDGISIKEVTDADFDFDRNSTGTRVNEDYLIEDVPYNLATYSESINNWTTTNAPTVTTNIAIAPDGTSTADGLQDTTGSNFKRVRTNISVSGNSTFTGSCFIKKVSSETGNTGFALVFSGTSTKVAYGIIDSVNGTMISQSSTITPVFKIESANNDYWRFSMTATDTGSNTSLEFSIYGTLSSNGTSVSAGAGSLRTIWGAQLVKGNQKDYLKTTDRLDIPRIDYTNGEPSILLEPSRTNLVTYSQDLSQWTLVNGTLTSNATVSPEGIQNAGKIVFSSVGLDLKRTITVVAGTTYTISFYIKVEEGTGLQGRFYDNSNSANIEYYNYDDQIIPNQWSRITRSVTAPSGCTEMQIWLLASSTTLVTASWWGAQF